MINLLIAEDHQSLIDGIDLLFRQDEDIKIVATANDGESLIELLKTHEADVVLTDINMPKMNGVEVCKHIKSNNNKIKVIAYTMFESPQAVRDMITAGADGYILKKRPLKEIREAILSIHNGQKYYDSSITIPENVTLENENLDSVLSKTELAILNLIAQNMTSSEIAEHRCTAVSTVFTHRRNMIRKLGLSGTHELIKYALKKFKHYE